MTDEARTVVYGGYTTEIVDKLTNDNVCEGCEDVCSNPEQHWVSLYWVLLRPGRALTRFLCPTCVSDLNHDPRIALVWPYDHWEIVES